MLVELEIDVSIPGAVRAFPREVEKTLGADFLLSDISALNVVLVARDRTLADLRRRVVFLRASVRERRIRASARRVEEGLHVRDVGPVEGSAAVAAGHVPVAALKRAGTEDRAGAR